jgi:xylose isomerase
VRSLSPTTSSPTRPTKLRADRYATFGSGKGADFAAGKMTLEELANIGAEGGEVAPISGKQELYEALINQYI